MPDDTYTPDDDHMRGMFCQGYAKGDFGKFDQAHDAWGLWLAAHDARVKAEALRDAAQYMREGLEEPVVVTGEEDDEDTWQEWTVADWLTNRADTIEKEAGA